MEEMPYDELLGWISYFERKPLEWRDDLRAAYIIKALGEKRSPQEIFPSLGVLFSVPKAVTPLAQKLVGSSLLQKMLLSTGGDKLEM
jgi:hypothetical protein